MRHEAWYESSTFAELGKSRSSGSMSKETIPTKLKYGDEKEGEKKTSKREREGDRVLGKASNLFLAKPILGKR
jgi:hypothetical protein